MIPPLSEAVAAAGPLLITEVEYADPTLAIVGDGWTLNALCSWRIVRGTELVLSWSSPTAPDEVWELIGRRIVDARTPGRDLAVDLSDGSTIEFFSDSDVDPWVMRLPAGIYVGPLFDD